MNLQDKQKSNQVIVKFNKMMKNLEADGSSYAHSLHTIFMDVFASWFLENEKGKPQNWDAVQANIYDIISIVAQHAKEPLMKNNLENMMSSVLCFGSASAENMQKFAVIVAYNNAMSSVPAYEQFIPAWLNQYMEDYAQTKEQNEKHLKFNKFLEDDIQLEMCPCTDRDERANLAIELHAVQEKIKYYEYELENNDNEVRMLANVTDKKQSTVEDIFAECLKNISNNDVLGAGSRK